MTTSDSLIDNPDFKVEAVFPHPIGGQQVGMRPVDVKVTHLPTGLYAVCGYERSQHKNKAVAMLMVQYGLAEIGWNQ